jgi:type IV secretory pathway VirJ component
MRVTSDLLRSRLRRLARTGVVLALALAGLMLAAVTPAAAAPRAILAKNDTIGEVKMLAPASEPTAFVFFISDKNGLTGTLAAEAETLVGRGAAVALIDLNALIRKEAETEDDDTCHYVFGDLEDLARIAERQLGMTAWRWPIMLGLGNGGGALAYLAIAQAPANTAAGAISIGFSPELETRLPLCPGASNAGKNGDAYTYAPMDSIPGRWDLILPEKPDASIQAFIDASSGTELIVNGGSDQDRFAAAADAVFDIASQPAGEMDDLPLVELPAKGHPAALFVFISGDGGWRDIDKQVGEYLAAHGVSVVGVDSLRYFWSAKTPQQIAADLDRIISHYTARWRIKTAALGGYSFGADVIPLAWRQISPANQARISLLALMGLEMTADLQVTVNGWLGMSSSSEVDVRPYLSDLPKTKVMCFYGTDEQKDGETACTANTLAGAARVERPGGHHFDGDYQPVARLILGRLEQVANR